MALPRLNLPPTNLPAELTSFIGRRQELADVTRTLSRSRLLTLTGPGGVGKTKLALRAARRSIRQYPDGMWFVELAAVQDPALVMQAVFAALGLQDRTATGAVTALKEYLANKRCLLILDNCEHVLAEAALFAADILQSSPAIHVLSTSRQALGIAGEVVVDVPTLSLPEQPKPSLADVLLSDAVALFVERARARDHAFTLHEANAVAVTSVCAQLDGIALAIELAAVRVNGLGLELLNESLSARLDALGSGDPTRPHRQQTIDAAIDWSYQLLDAGERTLWRRVSVFSGGFEIGAVANVCGDDGLPAERIRVLIPRLVDRSILKRRDGPRGGRFRMLEPLRQFGRERLEESGELDVLLARHRDWVASLAAVVGAPDARQVEALERIHMERANLWSALDFCRTSRDEAEVGAAIVRDLWTYWLSHGPATDVNRLIDDLLALVPPGSRAHGTLLWVGGLLESLADPSKGGRMGAEALAVGRARSDPDIVLWAMQTLGVVAYLEGRSGECIEIGVESLALATAMGWPYARLSATVCRVMGQSTVNVDEAIALAREGIALSESLGESYQRASLQQFLAAALLGRGDHVDALEAARRSLELRRDLGDLLGVALALETLAAIASTTGAADRATRLIGIAATRWESIPAPIIEPLRALHDRVVLDARAALGSARFEAAYLAGKASFEAEGIDYALGIERMVAAPKPKATLLAATNDGLSRREMEVARLVAGGSTNGQVASSLFISERTVESHLASIFNKLGVDNRMQLARWVMATETPAQA